ncbi:hypothetical protein QVD17_37981 [Tagetes erecta]|uniref:HAT C-terminal dimerisation domain-containing protein n=1 Tax=Tagetes erecta TaxID=13708 RepID=A0AAD8JZD4_TARER|nr:hypothetical protein QVD17_37981 [Tagetes erecta]
MASTQDSQEDDTFVNETPFSQLNNDADPGNMEQSRKRKQDTNVEETQNKAQKVGKERAKCWSHFDVIYIDEEDGVKRKWNSTYEMLKSAVDLKEAFVAYEIEDGNYFRDLEKLPGEEEFEVCKLLVQFLEKFKIKTEIVSATSKPLAHVFIKEILDVDKHLRGKMVTEVEDRLHGLFMIYKERLDNVNCNSASQEARNEEVVEGDDDNEFLAEFFNVEESNSVATGTELKRYILEPRVTYNKRFDILMWWKQNAIRFPIVSRMAKDILAIQISTVASESAFSTSGRVLDPYRTRLSSNIVEALVCTQDWVRKSRKPIVDDVADILNDDDIAIEIEDAINKQKEKGKGIRS